jgi:hypothetical protein
VPRCGLGHLAREPNNRSPASGSLKPRACRAVRASRLATSRPARATSRAPQAARGRRPHVVGGFGPAGARLTLTWHEATNRLHLYALQTATVIRRRRCGAADQPVPPTDRTSGWRPVTDGEVPGGGSGTDRTWTVRWAVELR